MAIHTGVTASILNGAPGYTPATASLIVREFAGASDAIYTVSTAGAVHNYLQHGQINPSYFTDKYFFTFVVTVAPQSLRDLCRRAISQGQASFNLSAEVKVTQNSGWQWSSAPFVIACYPPVIRDVGF